MSVEESKGLDEGGGGSAVPKEAAGVGVVVRVPRVTARTFPGPASPLNARAIHWGGHGLLAYGSNYTVVVVDTVNAQLVQCLDRHKSMVRVVLWPPHRRTSPHQPQRGLCGDLQLVSADATGHIIVWDVCTGKPHAVLHEVANAKPIIQMSWIEDCEDILAVLQPPYSLVLWNTRQGTKVWRKTYTEPLLSFSFDPFHPTKMAFQCSECILFVDDMSVSRVPSSNGRKLYITAPRAAATPTSSHGDISSLRRLMKDIVIGDTKPKWEEGGRIVSGECLELSYHKSLRHHLLLLYPRELLILDLHINHTVAIVPLGDKASSPYMQVYSCRQRDVLYCLHESGSVSVKTRRRPTSPASVGAATASATAPSPAHSVSSLDAASSASSTSGGGGGGQQGGDVSMEMAYDARSASEPVRQVRGLQVLGMAVSPVCERRIAVYVNTGKVVLLEVSATAGGDTKTITFSAESPDGANGPVKDTLSDIIPPLFTEGESVSIGAMVTGVVAGAASALSAMRMCPPITTRNWQQYTPLLAAGTAHGLLYIFNVASGELEREFHLHTYTVRGIEWTGLKSVLSYAYPQHAGGSSHVRNEMCVTDVRTGDSRPLRADRGEEPPIDIVRVSPLKQYLVIVLAGGPVELWDLNTLHILRALPKKFPVVAALEWSPSHNTRPLRRRQSSKEDCLLDAAGSSVTPASTPTGPAPTFTPVATPTGAPPPLERLESAALITAREHLVFCDVDSQLYHFTIEGHQLRDGMRIPQESDGGSVTCLAFKAEQIVQGDADGLVSVWDLRLNRAHRHNTQRGYITKMRFAPGKGNLKLLVLYNDGVDIIDLKGEKGGFEKLSTLRCPRDMVKVLDIDWAASDRPILATADGCLRIMDMALTSATSTILDYDYICGVGCTALLPSDVAMRLRDELCWQPQQPYTLNMTESHGFTAGQLERVMEVVEQLEPSVRSALLSPELGTAERCLLTARIFGDVADVDFWTVAIYFLRAAKGNGSEAWPLDTCYDVIQDAGSYSRVHRERLLVQESRRSAPDYAHTRHVIQQLILLEQTDRAVQLLLETDLTHSNYYTDAIKACLVATVRDSQAAQSTIKLVATNLIAGGAIWDGVQLLCLIGKGLDACRYLHSYGHWGAATWLARAILPPEDARQVLKKWADHLSAQGHKDKAVLVLLSIEEWSVAHSLVSSVNPARAALFRHALADLDMAHVIPAESLPVPSS